MDGCKQRVLVVDDDEDDYFLISDILSKLPDSSFETSWIGSGEAALYELEHTAYDVCILDYELGDLNGLDILSAMNEKGLTTPVIFLTGYDDCRLDLEAMEAGAADYLVKGRFSPDMLARSIRYSVKQKSIEGELRKKNLELSEVLEELEDRIERRTVDLRNAYESLLHLSKAVEQAGEAIILLDTGGFIQYVNPAFERITGYSRVDVIGEHIRLLNREDRDEKLYEKIGEQLKRGEIWEGRIEEKKKDGSVYWADTTFSPVFDSLGKHLSYVAIKRDVTREVAIEARQRQSQKLEAIGVLSAGIAHDFNNILGAAGLFTELAMDEISVESAAAKDLEEVLDACNRGKKLIEQMLSFSRTRGEQYEPVQLGPGIKETIRFLRSSLPSSIEIRTGFDTDPPGSDTVFADPTQIHQLLLNLCTNAAHAMRDKGGVLSVSLASVELGTHELDQLGLELQPGRYLRLEVGDTGHGIGPEIIDKIFTPYFTTKKSGEGSGMGLASAYAIARNHKGAIRVESKPGKTSFQVYFPAITPEVSKNKSEPLELSRGDEEILLVDDEQVVLRAGSRILKSLGYEATACASPAEALQLFSAKPDRFNLVITDLTMPGMSGTELAMKLSRIRSDIPIILCTGYGHSLDREEVESAGINKMLKKPVGRKALAKAIREILDS